MGCWWWWRGGNLRLRHLGIGSGQVTSDFLIEYNWMWFKRMYALIISLFWIRKTKLRGRRLIELKVIVAQDSNLVNDNGGLAGKLLLRLELLPFVKEWHIIWLKILYLIKYAAEKCVLRGATFIGRKAGKMRKVTAQALLSWVVWPEWMIR